MITLLLTILALFAFVIGYYIGKMSVLEETTESYKDISKKFKGDRKINPK